MWERKTTFVLSYREGKEGKGDSIYPLRKWGNLTVDGKQVLCCECSLWRFAYLTLDIKQLQSSCSVFEKQCCFLVLEDIGSYWYVELCFLSLTLLFSCCVICLISGIEVVCVHIRALLWASISVSCLSSAWEQFEHWSLNGSTACCVFLSTWERVPSLDTSVPKKACRGLAGDWEHPLAAKQSLFFLHGK